MLVSQLDVPTTPDTDVFEDREHGHSVLGDGIDYMRVSSLFVPADENSILTRSFRWRMSMRSVMPRMLRSSSLVRIGPSERRQRIVPFHRPSMTESIASIGHSEISFLETGIMWPDQERATDIFVSTAY